MGQCCSHHFHYQKNEQEQTWLSDYVEPCNSVEMLCWGQLVDKSLPEKKKKLIQRRLFLVRIESLLL